MNPPHCPIYFTAGMTKHPKWLIGLKSLLTELLLENWIFGGKIVFQDWRQFKKDLTSRLRFHLLRISISLFGQRKWKYKGKQYEYSSEAFWGNLRNYTRVSWDISLHPECDICIDFNTNKYPKIFVQKRNLWIFVTFYDMTQNLNIFV